MNTLKPPSKPFNPPRSPSTSSFMSENSGKEDHQDATGNTDLDEYETEDNLNEGEKSWYYFSNGESKQTRSNLTHMQRAKTTSESEEQQVLIGERLIPQSRKKKGLGKDGYLQKRSKLKEILLPQISIPLPKFQGDRPQSCYRPSSSTETTAKFELQSGYTEENGETVAKLSIDVEVKSKEIQELLQKEKTKLELVVRLEAYDPVKLCSINNREKPWRYPFPQGMTQIKVLPTLAMQKEVDSSAKNLEIRVELKVKCYAVTIPLERNLSRTV